MPNSNSRAIPEEADGEKPKNLAAVNDEKRLRIINEAMAEFKNGYKQASTQRIAEKAGVSKGLIFHYFKSKNSLLNALAEHAVKQVEDELLNLPSLSEDLIERIMQITIAKLAFTKRNPALIAFITMVYTSDDAPCAAAKAMLLKRLASSWQNSNDFLLSGVNTGIFREDMELNLALSTMQYTLTGYSESVLARTKDLAFWQQETQIKQELQTYLEFFKTVFYKSK